MCDSQEYPIAMEDRYGLEGWSKRYSPMRRVLVEGGAPVFNRPLAHILSAIAETCTTDTGGDG